MQSGAIPGLFWDFFVGSSTVESSQEVKAGYKWKRDFRFPYQLVNQVKQDFELTSPESTTINDWIRGIVDVEVPTLDIYGDEKISKWKKFVSTLNNSLLVSEVINSEQIFQHPIDIALENCIAMDPSTNGVFQCLIKSYDKWDKELNRIYQSLKIKLEPQGQAALKFSQLEWIEYRDKEFDLVDIIYPQDGAGKMSRNFNAARRVAIVKARVLELESYLKSRSSTIEEIFRI
jgi:uncharacterized protein YecT (DUF1311 family)